MTTVTIAEAKACMSKLIAEVERGGELLILDGEMPVARIIPFEQSAPRTPRKTPGSPPSRG